MPLRSDWSGDACPMARSLDVVGDPWVMLILRESFTGATRFEQYKRRLSIADNVLSKRLTTMVDAGLLHRVSYKGEQRTHAEYRLTEAGAELLPIVNALAQWGSRHTDPPRRGTRMSVVHLTCGETTTTPDVCSACGEVLTAETTAWRRPWLSRELTPLHGAD